MSYDRFATANYHATRGTTRYGIPRLHFTCRYKIGEKECGKAFTSTAPKALYCDQHRDIAKRERNKARRSGCE